MSCFVPWIATDAGGMKRPIACGRCHDCRIEYSRQWAVRCMHEASCWDVNCFVTLTYAKLEGKHCFECNKDIVAGSLHYCDFQWFMRMLRLTGRKVRFYMCGEYGDETGRPHYHALLFNCWFGDMKYWRKSSSGFNLYRSEELERLWPHGQCEIGMVSLESAAYCARYVMKKRHGAAAEAHYAGRIPEFARMSLKPGIGAYWFEKYGRSDVLPDGMIVHNGVKGVAPKFYRRRLKARFPLTMAERAVELDIDMRAPYVSGEMEPERLAAKAQVSAAARGMLKREV